MFVQAYTPVAENEDIYWHLSGNVALNLDTDGHETTNQQSCMPKERDVRRQRQRRHRRTA